MKIDVGEKLSKQEFARRTGLSAAQVRKLCDKGSFSVQGLGDFVAEKTGTAKTSPILIELVRADAPGNQNRNLMQLKADKLKEEIALLQMRRAEYREKIESEHAEELLGFVVEVITALGKELERCNLSSEDRARTRSALRESLNGLKTRLQS